MPPIRILIADDHTLMRQGLHQLCGGLGGFTVVGEAANGAQAVALARDTRPDVILMDFVMPEVDGVEAIRQIVRETPTARIIALTMYREEPYMLDAIWAGARGYLLKTVEAGELVAAIEAVHRGEYLIDPLIAARVLSELHLAIPHRLRVEPLTEGEMAVLRLVAQGVDNKDIAPGAALLRLHRVQSPAHHLRKTLRDQPHPGRPLCPAPGLGHARRAARFTAAAGAMLFAPRRVVRPHTAHPAPPPPREVR